jgi:hypothetical protein
MAYHTEVIYGIPGNGGEGVVVEIDEAIFDLMTREKRPGETYNDVLRRIFGLAPNPQAQRLTGEGASPIRMLPDHLAEIVAAEFGQK